MDVYTPDGTVKFEITTIQVQVTSVRAVTLTQNADNTLKFSLAFHLPQPNVRRCRRKGCTGRLGQSMKDDRQVPVAERTLKKIAENFTHHEVFGKQIVKCVVKLSSQHLTT